MAGTPQTRLVVVRGPSGAGKSTIAQALRCRMERGTALIEQDYVRRTLLWEWDTPGALNIDLIDTVARRTLAAGRDTIVEGILTSARYGDMLRALLDDHVGTTVCTYLDVPFDETVRRHLSRPQASQSPRTRWPRGGSPTTCSVCRGSWSSITGRRPMMSSRASWGPFTWPLPRMSKPPRSSFRSQRIAHRGACRKAPDVPQTS
ncbi:AAA family ATPase [Cellulomonas hominis]